MTNMPDPSALPEDNAAPFNPPDSPPSDPVDPTVEPPAEDAGLGGTPPATDGGQSEDDEGGAETGEPNSGNPGQGFNPNVDQPAQ